MSGSVGAGIKCFAEYCDHQAANSVVLNQSQVLEQLSERGHLRHITHDALNHDVFFKKISLQKATAFKGFCEWHERIIFKPLMDNHFNPFDYNHQLLAAYWGVINTLRDKRTFNTNYLTWRNRAKTESISSFDNPLPCDLTFDDLLYYRVKIEEELVKPSGKFSFIVRELPYIPVFTTYVLPGENNKQQQPLVGITEIYQASNAYLFCLLPQKETTYLVMGTSEDCHFTTQAYLEYLNSLSEKRLFFELNYLLFKKKVSWITSDSFYQQNVLTHRAAIQRFSRQSALDPESDIVPGFNIFES